MKYRGWAKSVQPLVFKGNNCMTQWLIGIFGRLIKLQRLPNQLCGGGKTNSF